MRTALIVLCCVCVAGLLALAFAGLREEPARGIPAAVVDAGESARVAALERELAAIRAEVAALRDRPDAPARTIAAEPREPATADSRSLDRDPAWYLAEYERSFTGKPGGSDYFRLAVEAWIVELAPDVARRLGDRTADPAFRESLARLLGDRRLGSNGAVVDALFAALFDARPESLGVAALESLAILGGPETGLALEKSWIALASDALRERALAVILRLAAPEQNRALARLFARAAKPAHRAMLAARVVGDASASALEVLRPASIDEESVRVAAAETLRSMRGEAFVAFVDEWLGYERVDRVRRILGAARQSLTQVPSYAPEEAIGPPDADARVDHPNAWASSRPDMGLQSLEVGFGTPRRASGVRIHEVCVAGAVVRVVAIDSQGGERELFSGVDPTTTPGVFALEFPTTSYAIARVRVVLDTDRSPGWSEIDAVELVGPDGNAWASSASATSWFGER